MDLDKIITLMMIIICPLMIFIVWFVGNNETLTMKIIATIYLSLWAVYLIYSYFKGGNK